MLYVKQALVLPKSKYGACGDPYGYIWCFAHECPGVTDEEIETGYRQILRLGCGKRMFGP